MGVHDAATGVLVAAEGQPWEPDALETLAAAPDLATLRRCLDTHDLLAVAATGTARVAVVAAPGPGVDRDLVERLAADGVTVVAVVSAGGTPHASAGDLEARLAQIGVTTVVAAETVATHLVGAVRAALPAPDDAPSGPAHAPVADAAERPAEGLVVAVWGPHGAPGRTTVATGVAAAAAVAGRRTLLLDCDPYGGVVAQQLGLTDETSGLLAAARQANTGALDPDRLGAAARTVSEHLEVLTGLPRPDRWGEVRPAALAQLLQVAAHRAELVVVDCGPGGEGAGDGGAARGRDAVVATALREAHRCVVVGSAEPVGLTRLARLLVDARRTRPAGVDHVVVNRMRPGLGWREHEVLDLVARLCPHAGVHVTPHDLAAADRAAQAGRSVVELEDSSLSRSVVGLARALVGDDPSASPGSVEASGGARLRGRFRGRVQTLSR